MSWYKAAVRRSNRDHQNLERASARVLIVTKHAPANITILIFYPLMNPLCSVCLALWRNLDYTWVAPNPWCKRRRVNPRKGFLRKSNNIRECNNVQPAALTWISACMQRWFLSAFALVSHGRVISACKRERMRITCGHNKNANGVRNVFLLGRARGPEMYGHLFPSRPDPRCASGNSVFFRDYKSSVEFGADPSLAQI